MAYHPDHYYQKLHELILKRRKFESDMGDMKGLSLTDFNFTDIYGKTLLHYACEAGDIEKIKYCLANGADINLPTSTPPYGQNNVALYGQTNLKPIEIALNAGHINAATFLMNAKADCSCIPLSNIKNLDAKEWFRNEIANAVKKWQKNGYKITTPDNFFSNNIFSLALAYEHPIARIAEINEPNLLIEFTHSEYFKQKKYEIKNAILFEAAAIGNISFIDLFFREPSNPQVDSIQNALNIAAANNQPEVIEYLLKLGAKINKVNGRKNTALMDAVINGNTKIVSLLLKHGANPNIKNLSGRNVLDLAIENNKLEIIDILLKHEFTDESEKKEFLNSTNHFGFTPLDLALKSKNDILIEQIKANMSSDVPGDESLQLLKPVNQSLLLNKISYFLKLNNRDSDLFPNNGGLCNGLSHLFLYYTSQGKRDYFFDTLQLMTSWDGSEEALLSSLTDCPQAKYYKNLYELFEQWTNDLIWFQQSHLKFAAQNDRVKQHNLIRHPTDNRNLPSFLYSSNSIYKKDILVGMNKNIQEERVTKHYLVDEVSSLKTLNQLHEILSYVTKMPPGTCIELRGFGHEVCLYINEDQSLFLYDANCPYKLPKGDFNSIFSKIVDFNYIARGINVHDKLKFSITIHNYKDPKINTTNEMLDIPKRKEDFVQFKEDSPNRYSPCHIAILTRNTSLLKKLIGLEHIDINSRDIDGRTALYLAIENHFTAGIDILLQSKDIEIGVDIMELCYKSGQKDLVERFSELPNVNMKDLLKSADEQNDTKLINNILAKGNIEVNDKTFPSATKTRQR